MLLTTVKRQEDGTTFFNGRYSSNVVESAQQRKFVPI